VKKGLPALCLGLITWLLILPIEAKAKPEFENQYLKIRLSPGWTVAASGDQVLNLSKKTKAPRLFRVAGRFVEQPPQRCCSIPT
jgi:hypothetical protein